LVAEVISTRTATVRALQGDRNMNKQLDTQVKSESEVNVDVKVESTASQYARVLRVRTGMKAGRADRCSSAA
jgi:hypothetical protein